MTLTPHIIRIPDITEEDLATLWVGTEENMRLRGPTQSALGQSPFAISGDEVAAGEPPTGGGVASVGASAEAQPADATADSGTPADDRGSEPGAGDSGTGVDPVPGVDPGDSGDTGDTEATDPDQPRGPTVVQLIPGATAYGVGDRVVVQVMIDNARNVGSVPFHLRYNRSVLEFVRPATEGSFLRSDGGGTIFLASDSATGGEVVVGLSKMGGGVGVSGSGVLATFEFQAINPGNCGFAFVGASVKDPRAQNLPATFVPTAVTVQ